MVGKGSPSRPLTHPLLHPRGRHQDWGQNSIQGGKKRNNGYSGLCQGHNPPPTPTPSPLMTQNINIQRPEGEAKQFPIQHQDFCWGNCGGGGGVRDGRKRGGRRGWAGAPWSASISFLSSQLTGEQRAQALGPTAEALSLPAV